jgi:DNA-binding response OmpR family regulator
MQPRVLLVHDDSAVRELSARTLGRMGVGIDIVPRGEDAVRALETNDYTVAVVDRSLCDGFLDVIAKRPDRPIVICTAAEKDAAGLDTAVVNLLIPQPYDASTLVGVIIACVTEKPPPALSP